MIKSLQVALARLGHHGKITVKDYGLLITMSVGTFESRKSDYKGLMWVDIEEDPTIIENAVIELEHKLSKSLEDSKLRWWCRSNGLR